MTSGGGRASALDPTGLLRGVRRESQDSLGVFEGSLKAIHSEFGRKMNLSARESISTLPQRVAPANPRGRKREVGSVGPSGSAARAHQVEQVKACVEDAATALGDRVRDGADPTGTQR